MGKIFNRYGSKEKEAFCVEWESSGLSQSQYCREKGINAMTFNGWVKKYLRGDKKFIPVKVEEEPVQLAGDIIELTIKGKLIIKLPSNMEVSLLTKLLKEFSKCI